MGAVAADEAGRVPDGMAVLLAEGAGALEILCAGGATHGSPLRAGAGIAVGAALLFGASTPFVQRFGEHVGAFTTAAFLYTGAALASLPGARRSVDAPLRARHLGRLAVVALAGAVVAPVCLAGGLHRTSATMASLLLASEAGFTVVLAHLLYREAVGLRVAVAVGLIGGGATLLVGGGATLGGSATIGACAVVLASMAWAVDSALSRPLADLDARHVVLAKSAAGAALAMGIAFVNREPAPSRDLVVGLVVTGGLGYGASLRLYLGAQRRIGAARTASIFATAPFIGAIVAWSLGDRTAGWSTLAAGALIGVGVYLHLSERHGHGHQHVSVEHEHAHRHDDGHHAHVHEPPFTGEHSHLHRHAPEWHEHPHGPDLHHQHDH
jgi:drug/metabolite transporter (DMT)-like permease